MILTQIIIQIVLVLLSLLLYFIFKSYWPKYFETKGTNQATKEDIGEITLIVEEIKSNLLKDTELLKAQISLSNQHRLDVKSAEREALINLNGKASAWFYYIVRFDFTSYSLNNYLDMNSAKIELSRRKYEYDLAQAHLNLFMYDKNILDLIRNFTLEVLKVEKRLSLGIIDSKLLFSLKKIKLDSVNADELEIEKEEHQKFMDFYNTYQKESIELYRTAFNSHAELVKLLSFRLKEIESPENI